MVGGDGTHFGQWLSPSKNSINVSHCCSARNAIRRLRQTRRETRATEGQAGTLNCNALQTNSLPRGKVERGPSEEIRKDWWFWGLSLTSPNVTDFALFPSCAPSPVSDLDAVPRYEWPPLLLHAFLSSGSWEYCW